MSGTSPRDVEKVVTSTAKKADAKKSRGPRKNDPPSWQKGIHQFAVKGLKMAMPQPAPKKEKVKKWKNMTMTNFFKTSKATSTAVTANDTGKAGIEEESGNGGGAVIGGEEEIDAEQAAGECRNENAESVKLTENPVTNSRQANEHRLQEHFSQKDSGASHDSAANLDSKSDVSASNADNFRNIKRRTLTALPITPPPPKRSVAESEEDNVEKAIAPIPVKAAAVPVNVASLVQQPAEMASAQPIVSGSPTPLKYIFNEAMFVKDSRTCLFCNRSFKTIRLFNVHKACHQGTLNHKCPECIKTFKGRSEVSKHMLAIHKRELTDNEITKQNADEKGNPLKYVTDEAMFVKESLKCLSCDMRLKTLKSFKRHKARHQGTLPHKCPECVMTFDGRFKVNQHMLAIHNRKLRDNEITKQNADQKGHLLKYVTDEAMFVTESLKCLSCDMRLKTLKSFKLHKARHQGTLNHKCPECVMTFNGRSVLNRHMLAIHKRELRDNEITKQNEMANGLRAKAIRAKNAVVATAKQPQTQVPAVAMEEDEAHDVHVLTCPQCGYKTTQKGALKNHVKKCEKIDVPNGKPRDNKRSHISRHKCEDCSHVASSVNSLIRHRKEHDDLSKVAMTTEDDADKFKSLSKMRKHVGQCATVVESCPPSTNTRPVAVTSPRHAIIGGGGQVQGNSDCGRSCVLCNKYLDTSPTFTANGVTYNAEAHADCRTPCVVYAITCKKHTAIAYVGSTELTLRDRNGGHRTSIRAYKEGKRGQHDMLYAEHFAKCGMANFDVRVVAKVNPDVKDSDNDVKMRLLALEDSWIEKMQTMGPHGLNKRTNEHVLKYYKYAANTPKTYHCHVSGCNVTCHSRAYLQVHERLHNALSCCGYTYNTASQLELHRRWRHYSAPTAIIYGRRKKITSGD